MTPDDILKGHPPAEVLRDYIAADPARRTTHAAIWLMEHFPRADSVLVNIVWNLSTPTRTHGGAPDEIINREILRVLREAGYL